MGLLSDVIGQISTFINYANDDFTDRLHHRYTVAGLGILLFFITSKQHLGAPMVCITPGASHTNEKYAEQMCWLMGTHKFNQNQASFNKTEFSGAPDLAYYQWMTLIIICQILLFMLPFLVWKFCNNFIGLNLAHVNKSLIKKYYLDYYSNQMNWPKLQDNLSGISEQIRATLLREKVIFKPTDHGAIVDQKTLNQMAEERRRSPVYKTKSQTSFFFLFIQTKFLYLINVLFQFFYVSEIFGFNYFEYGIVLFHYLTFRYDFHNNLFPKVGACEIKFPANDNLNAYMYRCSLPLNLFNELFYSFFWFWLWIIALATIASLIYWSFLLNRRYRRHLVLDILGIKHKIGFLNFPPYYYDEEEQARDNQYLISKTGLTLSENFDLFFKDVCSVDLVLVLQLIGLNTNTLAKKDILTLLWSEYLNVPSDQQSNSNQNGTTSLANRRPLPQLRKTKYEAKKFYSEAGQTKSEQCV